MRLRYTTICTLLAISSTVVGDVFCVDIDAPPGGDGLSWKTAFVDLQDGFDAVGIVNVHDLLILIAAWGPCP